MGDPVEIQMSTGYDDYKLCEITGFVIPVSERLLTIEIVNLAIKRNVEIHVSQFRDHVVTYGLCPCTDGACYDYIRLSVYADAGHAQIIVGAAINWMSKLDPTWTGEITLDKRQDTT